MPLSFPGQAVSRGIAIGRVRLQHHGEVELVRQQLPHDQLEGEVARFRHALESARQQLHALRSRIPHDTPQDIAAFIDTHLLMLEDSTLSAIPVELIHRHRCNAEWALKLQRDALVQVFDTMDDPYLKTRRDDVDHVVQRIQQILLQQEPPSSAAPLHDEPAVVVAHDLSPSDMLQLHHRGIAAIITERGGPLSHTAIMARSLGIPALVGVNRIQRYLHNGETVVVDADHGALLCQLDDDALADYHRRRQRRLEAHQQLEQLRTQPARSRDGTDITLQANIELPEDIDAMHHVGADGVGLYRTEFLYMNRRRPPDEEEQLQAYRDTIERLQGAPLTIRTLDLGADKGLLPGDSPGPNPALGLRAVRLCLKEPELFRTQLRAILRASAHGPLRLLIPMLTTVQELEQTLQLIQEQKQALSRQGVAFDAQLPVGGMIEVPAAALSTDLFARRLDFLSIGTNDLMQYTLATDRTDEAVSHLFDPLNPGVLRLIDSVLRAGRQAGVPVAMCGEMAGDPALTPLLLALGLTQFSAPPARLPEVKQVIRGCEIDTLRHHLGNALYSADSTALAKTLHELST
ncbi:MAG: phosphoenolpyruvate--protein phosphotransferase [Pseudomonadota bacterium]